MKYIDDEKKLKEMCSDLMIQKRIGVDLECENGLHHYGTYVALIQVSTETENYIIDTIKLKNIDDFLKILSSKDICKVFHDIGFDFRIIKKQYNCNVVNFFDTQVAASFLGYENLGLGDILQKHFNVNKKNKFQRADWTKRPISEEMLKYAIKDSSYLIKLSDILQEKLKEKGMLNWVQEEFLYLEKTDRKIEMQSFSDLKNFKKMNPVERSVLKNIFEVREKLAKKLDKPVFFVINNNLLASIAQSNFKLNDWKNIKRVHPAVKGYAEKFYEAQEKGKKEKIELEKVYPKKLSGAEKSLMETLTRVRNNVANDYGVKAHIIASKEQIKNYAISKDKSIFRKWQVDLLKV